MDSVHQCIVRRLVVVIVLLIEHLHQLCADILSDEVLSHESGEVSCVLLFVPLLNDRGTMYSQRREFSVFQLAGDFLLLHLYPLHFFALRLHDQRLL